MRALKLGDSTLVIMGGKGRVILVGFILGLMPLCLIYKNVVIAYGSEENLKVDLVLMNRQVESLSRLNRLSTDLEMITENIENYSFAQIKKSILDTVDSINLTNREIQAQYDSWVRVKNDIKHDREVFLELRDDLSQIQMLQDNEILKLKDFLESAEKTTLVSDSVSLFLTFFVGVLSSISASAAWRLVQGYWKKKISEKNQYASENTD